MQTYVQVEKTVAPQEFYHPSDLSEYSIVNTFTKIHKVLKSLGEPLWSNL